MESTLKVEGRCLLCPEPRLQPRPQEQQICIPSLVAMFSQPEFDSGQGPMEHVSQFSLEMNFKLKIQLTICLLVEHGTSASWDFLGSIVLKRSIRELFQEVIHQNNIWYLINIEPYTMKASQFDVWAWGSDKRSECRREVHQAKQLWKGFGMCWTHLFVHKPELACHTSPFRHAGFPHPLFSCLQRNSIFKSS